MNILHLIGNGFDVNLDMKTSYADFYKHYVALPSASEVISKLKVDIARYRESNKWSDLEKGLGLYTTELKTVDEVYQIYFDINDELKAYLIHQMEKASLSELKYAEKLKHDLSMPYFYFPLRNQRVLVNYMNPGALSNDTVNIITYNYTDTIEKVLNVKTKNISLELSKKNQQGYQRVLQSINHIHGTIYDTELILGVNDVSQIANESFRSNEQVLDMLVKPTTTVNRGDLTDDHCTRLIQESDMICLFGLSLGETDNKWWAAIAERMKLSKSHIIYYAYCRDDIRHSQDRWNKEREYRRMLIDIFMSQDIAPDNLESRIHVLVNSNMFGRK